MWKYVCLWLPMVLIAVLNGLLRQMWYGRYLDELTAHQISTLIGLVLFGMYIWISLHFFPPATALQAWAIGFLWLALTVAFEFLFGHYLAGHSWTRLFQDYNLLAGRVWLFIPLWLAVAPRLVYWWRD